MASNIIDLGSLSINVTKENYDLFFNQQAKQETKKNRAVFKTDYQRFIWAFVLGIKTGKSPKKRNKAQGENGLKRFAAVSFIMWLQVA